MSSRVRKLPPEVIRRIAAGEVVDGPASVVRELVENALDASAQTIQIFLEKGGRDVIVVEDDGVGILREDLPQVVERYTTSKIVSPEDLYQIRTLGFRGEALHAIASVSHLTIITRTQEDETGWRATFQDARLIDLRPDPRFKGTRVEVRDLFWNFPPRRNFLRKPATERRRVLDVVTAYALAHPNVCFHLEEDGNVLFHADIQPAMVQRLEELYGKDFLESLEEVREETADVTLYGWIAPPHHTGTSRALQWIFLNGRPIRDDQIRGAIYRALSLPPGRHPQFFLYLQVDAAKVDYHVHPQKREVRFARDLDLPGLLIRGLKRTFSSPLPDQSDQETPTKASIGLSTEPSLSALETKNSPPSLFHEETLSSHPFQFIQVFGTYLIFERGGELWLVDQHAAHERILYEQLLQTPSGPRTLLFPMLLHLSADLGERLEEHREALESYGFRFRTFAPGKVVVDAVPSILSQPSRETLLSFLEEVETEGGWTQTDRILKTLACKSAIKAGDPLRPGEAQKLVEDLLRCQVPQFCPHGRPIIWRISKDVLDRKFGR